MKWIKNITLIIALIAICILLSYGGWIFSRSINYKYSYKNMVEQTVRDMVKQEALR